MIVKALTKTLHSISDILARRSNQSKMMAHHLGLGRAHLYAISKH
jgi:hypothetical protein